MRDLHFGVVTPLDPHETGVAEYIWDLIPYLAKHSARPVLIFGDKESFWGQQTELWQILPIKSLPENFATVDLLIYQMGNSPAHDFMAPFLRTYPGIIVLHDVSLYHFYARLAHKEITSYLRAFGFAFGLAGREMAHRYLKGEQRPRYPDLLLSEWVSTYSPAVVVHSQHAATILMERCTGARIEVVPMPIRLPALSGDFKDQIRQKLGIPEQAYVVAVFGVVNISKNPIAVLEALRRLRLAGAPAFAVFIGWENSDFRLLPEVERRGLQDSVTFLGFLEDRSEVDLWLAAADVGVGLRLIYWGETPSSTLRMMAVGIPVIVNDIGAFSELPEMACIKIPNTNVEEILFVKLQELYQDRDQRMQMGAYARRYIQDFHNPDRVALSFIDIGKTLARYDF